MISHKLKNRFRLHYNFLVESYSLFILANTSTFILKL